MKTTLTQRLRIIAASVCLASTLAYDASAAFYYWDPNGLDTPAGGTWDLTTAQWSTDAGPTATPVLWDPTAAAVFSVTNSPGSASTNYGNFTINLDSAIGIGGLYNDGINGSTPATNLIFSGTGSLNLASGINVFSAGNGSIGGGGGNNNIFRVPITGSGSIDFQANVGSEYLTVANTYSGGTTISTGNGINFSTSGVFGTGAITVNPNQSFIVLATPATEPVSAGGAAFATGPITIENDVVASTGVAGKVILVGSATAPVTFTGDWNMGSQNQTLDFRNGTVAAPTTISGAISGSGTFTKTGNGVLVLSGDNTYSGKTVIGVGTLSVSSINNVAGGSASSSLGHPTTVANGTIGLGATTTAGTLLYTGSGETTDRKIDLAGTTGGGIIQNDGTGALTFTSALTATGAGSKALTLQGSNADANTVSGAIVNNSAVNITSLTKAGTGSWTLSGANTYSGATKVSRGTLNVNSINSVVGGSASSSLGHPITVANGTISLGASTTLGILRYLGAGETSDRVINLSGTTGGATIQNDGSGALVFSSDFTATGNGAKTLTLRGSNKDDNTINGKIVDSTSATSVTKTDSGKWILNGVNTYSGTTTVSAGTLGIGNASAIGTGTFAMGNGSYDNTTGGALTIANTISLTGNSTFIGTDNLALNGAATLTGNRTVTVSANTLTFNSAVGENSAGRNFTKAGAGKLVLNGANTYTGITTVSAGVLAVNGSLSSLTNVVAAGGTLDLSGSISGGMTLGNGGKVSGAGTVIGTISLDSGSTIAPGSSPGTLATGAQTWNGGAHYAVEINDAAGTAGTNPGWDLISITGGLTINATPGDKFNIDVISLTLANTVGDAANFDSTQNHAFTIVTASGGITGFDAGNFNIDTTGFSNTSDSGWYLSQNGNDISLNFAPVPEPSVLAFGIMGGFAFVGFALRGRFKK
jgi:autotransporter-associated beta strand protein